MIEGGFFQSIKNETGAETGVEDGVQRTVEVVMRGRFAEHADAFLRARVQVLRDFDGVSGDHFAVERSFLDAERHTSMVETRVGEGEDKAATGFDDLANAAHQGVDLGHVHDGHVADGSVEAELPEGDNLVLAGGIEEVVFDAVGIFGGTGAGTFKKLLAEVSSDDVDTKLGHAACEYTIATGDLEHRFAGLQVEQAFARGSDEETLKIVATIAHSVVPERGFLVPKVARFFIQINWLRYVFGSHRGWFPFWSFRCVLGSTCFLNGVIVPLLSVLLLHFTTPLY
jgi:hypothetical protein